MVGIMVRVQHLFPRPMLAKLKTVSKSLDTTVSELIRRAVREWLGSLGDRRPRAKAIWREEENGDE